MKKITLLFSMLFSVFMVVNAQSVLFEENFDDGGAYDRWTFAEDGFYTNLVTPDYDYLSEGIDAAPNGGGLGLKMEVNTEELGSDYEAYLFAFPNEQSFMGEYTLTFDMYMSYTDGGSGTTEFSVCGVGHLATDVPSSDGYDFAITPDNGASVDIRVYDAGVETTDNVTFGSPDGSQNQDSEYYGASYEGTTPGNQWLQIKIDVTADSVIYYVNDLLWSEIAATDVNGNFLLGYMDWFSGSVADEFSYVIYDNVKVIDPNVSVASKVADMKVALYPNPANDYLNIEVSDLANVEIVNSLGQVVISTSVNGNQSIDISNLNNGVYFAKVTNLNGNTKTQKVVIE